MSWCPPTQINQFKNQSKYKPKQTNKNERKGEIILKGKTKYIPLIPKDALYRENLFLLSNPEFQEALLKVLRDLNALLYMSEKDFFDQLQQCDSLRVCLESCLVCLCKNPYYNLCSSKIQQQNQQQTNFPNQFFTLYEKLNELILQIYFRITHTQSTSHQSIIYNSWLLDVPKIIDFCMIYCIRTDQPNQFTNLDLTRSIVAKAVLSNPQNYSNDFDDFINILYQDKLPLIHRDIKLLINLTPQAMHQATKNFHDPLRIFLITSHQILFQIKDLFTIISYVYRCFPTHLSQKLATDHQVLEDTIRIFIEFTQNTPQWKVGSFQKQFQTNFQDIQRAACECYLLNFLLLRNIIERGDNLTNNYFSRAMISYSVHCMYLMSDKVNLDYQKIYQRMITTIIQLFDAKDLFFMREAPEKLNFVKLKQHEKVCIQKSFSFVQKVSIKLKQDEEDRSVENSIKQKIDDFFKKTKKPKQQNKLLWCSTRHANRKTFQSNTKNSNYSDLDESMSSIELDFSALNIKQTDLSTEQTQEDLDLSFSELKNQQDTQKKFNHPAAVAYHFKKNHQVSKICYQTLKQQHAMEQEQRKIYQESLKIEYEDEEEQLQSQENTYYQSNKPQFGAFTDRLIQMEDWISNFQ